MRPGICCTVAASGGLCEGKQLQEVVGGADHGPFGTYFLDAAQQELAEAACLFDLSEHRLHHLLSQSVRRFEADTSGRYVNGRLGPIFGTYRVE